MFRRSINCAKSPLQQVPVFGGSPGLEGVRLRRVWGFRVSAVGVDRVRVQGLGLIG